VHDYYSRKQFFSFFPDSYDGERENVEIEKLVLEKLESCSFFKDLQENEKVNI
jgi:hypothetical protein